MAKLDTDTWFSQAQAKCQGKKGKYGVSLFETVFGFKHCDHDGIESFKEMRKCCTVVERMAMSSNHTNFFKMMKSNKDWVYVDTKDNPEEKDDHPLWPDMEELPGDVDLTKESEEGLGGFPPGGFKESSKPVEDKTVLNKHEISVEDVWMYGYEVVDVTEEDDYEEWKHGYLSCGGYLRGCTEIIISCPINRYL